MLCYPSGDGLRQLLAGCCTLFVCGNLVNLASEAVLACCDVGVLFAVGEVL
jgi:hypothetical protein